MKRSVLPGAPRRNLGVLEAKLEVVKVCRKRRFSCVRVGRSVKPAAAPPPGASEPDTAHAPAICAYDPRTRLTHEYES